MENLGSYINISTPVRISHSKNAFLEYSKSEVLTKRIKYYNGFIEFVLLFT